MESLRLDPDNKEALLLMGKLLIVHKKEVEAARKYLERILSSYPNDYRSLTNCGATYVETKSFTKAVAYFEAALRAKKDEIHASFGLAHCLFETGKYQMTFERCLTALTVNPWRKEDIDVRQQASGLMLHLAIKLGPLTDFKKVSVVLHTRLGNL
ncbi:MAG: tetratricopeptide repeat protein, partial [Bacteroidales bacterium]|nr:tetratricopeptide repeat protein [Bacteroidales bacterium]